jgi:N-methylhydantoinase A
MQAYLRSLEQRLGRRRGRVFVMQSSGGVTDSRTAALEPVRTVLSGPAGGVVGAAAVARRSGFERIIAFDMGGTSTDVSLLEGRLRATSEAEVAGLPVRVPMLDIHTVGAGGGSLARFDAAGALRVGPESAGADPGPICYGRGRLPTVTDANLLLGRLRPEKFLGGDFTLDAARTRRLTREWLRRQRSQLSLEEFALGVLRVVNATMEKAIRVVSVERGYDPRDFTLVAFGGAGAMHACELAAGLSIPRVLVPALPGALSAFGILVSDVVRDYSQTVLVPGAGSSVPLERLRRSFGEMRKQAAADLQAQGWQGRARYEETLDLRYRGQGYELNVDFGPRLLEEFAAQHQRRYGYAHAGRQVEIVTLRLRARIPAAPLGRAPARAGTRRCVLRRAAGEHRPAGAGVVGRGAQLRRTGHRHRVQRHHRGPPGLAPARGPGEEPGDDTEVTPSRGARLPWRGQRPCSFPRPACGDLAGREPGRCGPNP